MMGDYTEIIIRLLSAVVIGCVIGLDRNLHGKPTGVKTLGLVALGASLLTMTSMDFATGNQSYSVDALSRTIQGVITGIGFLGAGVIVHESASQRVHGLTTAASIWVTAAIGIVCGMGAWRIAGVAVVIVLALFLFGRPLEKMLHRPWLKMSNEEREAISKHEE